VLSRYGRLLNTVLLTKDMAIVRKIIHKISSHSFLKNTVIVMGGSVIGNALAYFYHLAVGRILGPSQYGELGALLSIFYILNVPSGVVQTGLTKYFSILNARQAHGEAKTLLIRSFMVLSACGLLGFIILIPFLHIFAAFLPHTVFHPSRPDSQSTGVMLPSSVFTISPTVISSGSLERI